MKTILVTGGTGFIGNCFCKLLLKEKKDWKSLCQYWTTTQYRWTNSNIGGRSFT